MSMPAPPIKRCAKLALTAYSGARLHALQGQVVESLVLCTRLTLAVALTSQAHTVQAAVVHRHPPGDSPAYRYPLNGLPGVGVDSEQGGAAADGAVLFICRWRRASPRVCCRTTFLVLTEMRVGV